MNNLKPSFEKAELCRSRRKETSGIACGPMDGPTYGFFEFTDAKNDKYYLTISNFVGEYKFNLSATDDFEKWETFCNNDFDALLKLNEETLIDKFGKVKLFSSFDETYQYIKNNELENTPEGRLIIFAITIVEHSQEELDEYISCFKKEK